MPPILVRAESGSQPCLREDLQARASTRSTQCNAASIRDISGCRRLADHHQFGKNVFPPSLCARSRRRSQLRPFEPRPKKSDTPHVLSSRAHDARESIVMRTWSSYRTVQAVRARCEARSVGFDSQLVPNGEPSHARVAAPARDALTSHSSIVLVEQDAACLLCCERASTAWQWLLRAQAAFGMSWQLASAARCPQPITSRSPRPSGRRRCSNVLRRWTSTRWAAACWLVAQAATPADFECKVPHIFGSSTPSDARLMQPLRAL